MTASAPRSFKWRSKWRSRFALGLEFEHDEVGFASLHKQRSNLAQAAARIDHSVDVVLENPSTRTADLQGTMGCRAFGRVVAERVAA